MAKTLRDVMIEGNCERHFFIVSPDLGHVIMVGGIDPFSDSNPEGVNKALDTPMVRIPEECFHKVDDFFGVSPEDEEFFRNEDEFYFDFVSATMDEDRKNGNPFIVC